MIIWRNLSTIVIISSPGRPENRRCTGSEVEDLRTSRLIPRPRAVVVEREILHCTWVNHLYYVVEDGRRDGNNEDRRRRGQIDFGAV